MTDLEVSLESVTVAYGPHRVVEDVTLALHSGELLALVGPNGGGKSTLLKAILGLVPVAAGRIDVRGQAPRPGHNGLGYVPQSSGVDIEFPLTVREVVSTGLLTRQKFWSAQAEVRRGRAAVDDVLDRLGLTPLSIRPIGDLSGGQRQRVLIGRALVSRPYVLLLDEPTSHLDPQAREEIYGLLSTLTDSAAILIVSHDVDQVEQVADRVARLDRRLTWPHAGDESEQDALPRARVAS
jgi:zinc transport system ATP-binding protein